jgi:VWFA-related protein
MKGRTVGIIALVAAFSAAPIGFAARAVSAGQDKKQDRPLRHDAAAIVKLVAVRVQGPDGRPVHGLRKEDFTLFEDGQSKTITEFEIHTITEAGMTMTPELPPSAQAAGRAAEAMNRKLFFFLDQQASDQAGKDKAKAAALRFLDTQVRPGDEVAVIGWYAMSGFYIREYLTTDRERIRQAIDGVTEIPPSPGEAVGMPPDEVEEGPEGALPRRVAAFVAGRSSTGVEIPPRGGGGTVAPGTAAFQRVDFVPRLAEIAEVFKTIPGPKSLILFTARDLGPEAERLGRLFGAAGTAVYAVNTQDWKMGPFLTKFKYIWTDHSLKDLSAASGGAYFADINDASGIALEIQDLTGNYYVLGYYVQDSWDGRYHRIRVEVARPDARVLVQDGFTDSKPFDSMSDFEKEIQLLELLWSDQPSSAPVILSIEPLVVSGEKSTQGCLLTKWDVGAKTGPPAAPVEVLSLLRDGAGAILVSRKWDVDLRSYDGRTIWAYIINPLGTGTHELRLVVRDKQTGVSCVGRARFGVAAPAAAGVLLSSPMLFEDGPSVSFLRLSTGRLEGPKGKPARAGPSIASLYRLIPKEGGPVAGEVAAGTKHLLAIMPLEFLPRLADDTPILNVEAKLVPRPEGTETPVGCGIREFISNGGSPSILAIDLVFPPIAPGIYDLEIAVEDVGMDRRAAVRKMLTVR